MKKMNKLRALLLCAVLLLPILGGALRARFSAVTAAAQAVTLISTREQLTAALASAEDGAVLLVDDVDFGLPDLPLSVSIRKSVTIKGGKEDGRAQFTNGAFQVEGLADTISVGFENIDFRGSNTEAAEFLFENERYLADGVYVPPQLKRHMFNALTLTGNVEAAVSDCAFTGYVSARGGAIYADNTGSDKWCSLRLDGTEFNGNAALSGGAVYAGENTALNALACAFRENTAKNGGALYIRRSLTTLDGCMLSENSASSVGGGMYVSIVEGTPVTLLNTSIYQNVADNGGGIGFIPNMGNNGKLNAVLCAYYGNRTQGEGYSFDLHEQPYANFFGCAVVDDALPQTYNETEEGEEYYTPWERQTPTSDNGYNYVALTAQSEEDGISVSVERNRLAVSGGGLPTVPKAELFEATGFDFRNAYGDFSVGSNARELTVRVNVDGKRDTHVFDYGQNITLPAPQKAGHTFVNWTTESGEAVELEGIPFGAEELVLVPVFTPNTYTLTLYFAQGPEQRTVVYGEEVRLPSAEKDKHDFIGWYTEREGAGTRWTDGQSYLADENVTLYARFKRHFPLGALLGWTFGALALAGIAVFVWTAWKKRERKLLSQAAEAVATGVRTDISCLSERERQVLELLLQGKKRSEIAGELYVSEETIKKQITSIYRKLDVTSRSELFAKFR